MSIKELKIEIPSYFGRNKDAEVIARLAAKHKLDYEAAVKPQMRIYESDKLVFETGSSGGQLQCYIFGEEELVDHFCDDLLDWILDR